MYDDFVLKRLNELNEKVDTLLETQKMNARDSNGWVNKEDTKLLLDCSDRTLQTLRDNGTLPYSSPLGGSKFIYRRSDILKLLESGYTGKESD